MEVQLNASQMSQLELSELISSNANQYVLEIGSDLCYENAPGLLEAFYRMLDQMPKAIEMDMGDVRSIDSSGLKALLQCRKHCREKGVKFKIGDMSACVVRILQMSGLDVGFGIANKHTDEISSNKRRPLRLQSHGTRIREYVVTANPFMVSILREKVIDAANEAGAIGDEQCDILIAVGEALTNAYRHGSPDKDQNKIKLKCVIRPDALVVEVADEGTPFDPDATTEPIPSELRDHGMGIYLMRQAMDTVDFETNCPGNRVRLTKWLRLCPKT